MKVNTEKLIFIELKHKKAEFVVHAYIKSINYKEISKTVRKVMFSELNHDKKCDIRKKRFKKH